MAKQTKKHPAQQQKKIGSTIAGIIAMGVLFFSCVVVNANGAAWGGNAGFDSLMTTLFFILFWSMFIVVHRNNSVLIKLYYVFSFLMCMAAACGFVLRLTDNGGFISAALVSIVAVPFYGLTIFADWTLIYGIATVITLWWMLYTGANVRRLKEETANVEEGKELSQKGAKKN